MAVFLLKSLLGADHVPPPATGIFTDVPADYFAIDWVEDLYARHITGGCQLPGDPLRYCPDDAVTREQMAVFLLKTLLGFDYPPPPAAGLFEDVPADSIFINWIEDIYNRQITVGCQAAGPAAVLPGHSEHARRDGGLPVEDLRPAVAGAAACGRPRRVYTRSALAHRPAAAVFPEGPADRDRPERPTCCRGSRAQEATMIELAQALLVLALQARTRPSRSRSTRTPVATRSAR